jgi:hypothetical protein
MRSFSSSLGWIFSFYAFWFLSALSAQSCKLQAANLITLSLFFLQPPKGLVYFCLLLVGVSIDILALTVTGSSYSCAFYVYPFWALGQWAFFIFLLDKFNFFHMSAISMFILGFVGGSLAVWTAMKLKILNVSDNLNFLVLATSWGLNLVALKLISNRLLK